MSSISDQEPQVSRRVIRSARFQEDNDFDDEDYLFNEDEEGLDEMRRREEEAVIVAPRRKSRSVVRIIILILIWLLIFYVIYRMWKAWEASGMTLNNSGSSSSNKEGNENHWWNNNNNNNNNNNLAVNNQQQQQQLYLPASTPGYNSSVPVNSTGTSNNNTNNSGGGGGAGAAVASANIMVDGTVLIPTSTSVFNASNVVGVQTYNSPVRSNPHYAEAWGDMPMYEQSQFMDNNFNNMNMNAATIQGINWSTGDINTTGTIQMNGVNDCPDGMDCARGLHPSMDTSTFVQNPDYHMNIWANQSFNFNNNDMNYNTPPQEMYRGW